MNPLPDIIVLDFCEWLKHKLDIDVTRTITWLDILVDNDNTSRYLQDYAYEFINQRRSECYLKRTLQEFLVSEEFSSIIENCKKMCASFKKRKYNDIYDCLECCGYHDIHHAFYRFLKRNKNAGYQKKIYDISEYDLANYMSHIIYSNNKIKNSPQFLQLMLSSKTEIAEEINFFNWLQNKFDNPTDVRKMPADVFEKYVDEYINSCGKSDIEKKHLLKSYKQTGWEILLKKIRIILRIDRTRDAKSLGEVAERYYSKIPRFKCIFLPLSDKRNQNYYRSLITDSWNDLNDLSGDYLDIYYSEEDAGKSGYDIAKRINSLPDSLKSKAPCLILWEERICDAKYIPLNELKDTQIFNIIKSIVNLIIEKKNLHDIVEEVNEKVKEIQDSNLGVRKYYGPVITGDGNIVGDNNAVGTGNIVGDANDMCGNTINADMSHAQKLIEEFEQAILAIKSSSELDDDLKAQICEIIEEAQKGIHEKSEEKQKSAKTAFGYVKTFLVKLAPELVSTLANFATIASFFGLSV